MMAHKLTHMPTSNSFKLLPTTKSYSHLLTRSETDDCSINLSKTKHNSGNGRAAEESEHHHRMHDGHLKPLLTNFQIKMESNAVFCNNEIIRMNSSTEAGSQDFSQESSVSNSPPGTDDSTDKSNIAKQDPKVCGVCGDKALGNNFNAITCESCKAFFRRNALKTKEFICPFNDNCKVDPVTRRFCQKCRLKKCFDIGMKKEWIMTEEEKKMKKTKIEQNRLKRQSSDTLPMANSSSMIDSPLHKMPCLSNDNSNPSTPGPVSLVMASSPATAAMNSLNYPLNIQTPSPPDPALPYTKGSKVAMTPTARSQYQQHNLNDPLRSTNYTETGHCSTSSEMKEQREAEFRALFTTPTRHEMNISQSLSLMDNQEKLMKYTGADMHQQQYWGGSGESSSSSSSSTPFSTPSIDSGPNSGSQLTAPSLNASILHANMQGYADQGTQQNKNSGSYKLLTSLIRPGITESPPDSNLIDCSASNITRTSEEYAVARQLSRLKQEEVSQEGFQFQAQTNSQSAYQQQLQPPAFIGEESNMQPLPLNTMDSILSVAITAEFNAFGVLGGPQCGTIQSSRELNTAERAKINELLLAGEALHAPVDAEGPVKVSGADHSSLINVINLTDIAIRRLIKMSKKISGFKNMCQEDQIALLKGSCTEMMILRSVVTYDPDRDSWNIPHSNLGYNIKLGVLKEARGNLYEEHQRFVRSFNPTWRLDENIMIILCAITLFTAERPNVVHKDVVKLEQDSYYYLLKRYLESIINGCEARSTYLQLIGKIAELHNLNSNHLRVFLEVNPREVEPLLIEIFDLK